MNGIELISKINNGELEVGTKLKYKFNGWDGELYKGVCYVDTAGSLLGLFSKGASISSVVIINGVFEIVK